MPQTPQALGLIFPVAHGIQIDLCAVNQQLPDGSTLPGSLCDHNCTSEQGGYDCPAAFTRNRGFKPKFANADSITNWVMLGREGLRLATEHFLAHGFAEYCQEFHIPHEVKGALDQNLREGLCEVNLFGGNPEMHPQVHEITTRLKNEGFRVNFTTTGRRFLTSEKFVKEFAANPPHLLALSADDFDPTRVDEMFSISLDDLKRAWKQINPLHGQEQKFYEAVYTARLAQEQQWPCAILFNMVLHPGNLPHIRQMMETISRHLPSALVNPYPAQDSFALGKGDLFDAKSIQLFSELVDWFIEQTLSGNPNITKRLQYWLVMKAVLQNCTEHAPAASQLVSGHYIWQCYKRPGANLYLQIGKGDHTLVNLGSRQQEPGGALNCYWNSSTVAGFQVSSIEQVQHHLQSGMAHSASTKGRLRCPGCSMPRLWFNMVSTELGLNTGLVEPYLSLRRQHAGF